MIVVEGEGKADLLLSPGIAATCAIGGAGKWKQYGYSNYLADLAGAQVVICPDRDEPGIKHANEIASDFPNALWLYSKPEHPNWNHLPKSGGFDVADWVSDLRDEGLSDSEVKERMLEAIMPERKVEVHQSKVDEGASEDDDLTIAFALTLKTPNIRPILGYFFQRRSIGVKH